MLLFASAGALWLHGMRNLSYRAKGSALHISCNLTPQLPTSWSTLSAIPMKLAEGSHHSQQASEVITLGFMSSEGSHGVQDKRSQTSLFHLPDSSEWSPQVEISSVPVATQPQKPNCLQATCHPGESPPPVEA